MDFKLVSDYKPTGDQPEAIAELVRSINGHSRHNTLLGVTGSGKTFTIANVIAQLKRPTLVLSHNKTLAAQLYGEFKSFFPENAVEYFVSYYDYYQPEAYLPASDTYIEKDLSINEEIEKLRLRTTASLLSGRRDIVVVSSVSCLYGIGNPEDFHASSVKPDGRRGSRPQENPLRSCGCPLYPHRGGTPERYLPGERRGHRRHVGIQRFGLPHLDVRRRSGTNRTHRPCKRTGTRKTRHGDDISRQHVRDDAGTHQPGHPTDTARPRRTNPLLRGGGPDDGGTAYQTARGV